MRKMRVFCFAFQTEANGTGRPRARGQLGLSNNRRSGVDLQGPRGAGRWEALIAALGPAGRGLFRGVPRNGSTGMVTVAALCSPHFVKVTRCDGGWKPRGD